jgi:hypothetical protein
MNCDKCLHKGVCKNEEIAREWEKKFKESEIFTTKPVYIFLQLTCKEFVNKYPKTKKEQ